MNANIVTGLKPLNSLVETATVPMLYWNFATGAVETINTTGTALPALTATGTPTWSPACGRRASDRKTYQSLAHL